MVRSIASAPPEQLWGGGLAHYSVGHLKLSKQYVNESYQRSSLSKSAILHLCKHLSVKVVILHCAPGHRNYLLHYLPQNMGTLRTQWSPLTVTPPPPPLRDLLEKQRENPPWFVSTYIRDSHWFILSLFLCKCACSHSPWMGMVTRQNNLSQVGICAEIHKVCPLWAFQARAISLISVCTASTPVGLWSDATFGHHHHHNNNNNNKKWTIYRWLPNNKLGVAVQRQCFWSATAYFFHVFNLQWTLLIYLHSLHYHGNWIRHSLHCTYPHNTTARYESTIILWVDSQITGLHSKSCH